MGGAMACGGDMGGFLWKNQWIPSCSQPLEAFFISGSSSFLGSTTMVSFEDVCGRKRSERSSFHSYDQDDNGDEEFDDYFHQSKKKRRLTVEQVKILEKNFELENKLEPERKIQLAKELQLEPRQVSIWYQNRRARWKSKQLENDFDALQASYNSLKADYDSVLEEKEMLQAEVIYLTEKLNLEHKNPVIDSTSEIEDAHISILPSKQDNRLPSAKSDILECSEHSHYANGGYLAAIADRANSSYAFEGDNSDISQDDQDYLRNTVLPSSPLILKIEDSNYSDDHDDDDDNATFLWPYWDVNCRM